MAAFLDTSYLLALELANDQNHAAALAHWRSVAQRLPSLVTTTYVFDETVTFFNSRGSAVTRRSPYYTRSECQKECPRCSPIALSRARGAPA